MVNNSQSDREKLHAFARNQDAEAFAALVAAHRPMVEQVCRRHLVLASDLDDAVQETFVKLARKADIIEGDVAAWLRAAAGTTAIDFARRYLRRRNHLETLRENTRDLPNNPATPSDPPTLPWPVLEQRLDEALGDLDPALRSLVIARFFEQTAVHEIARAQGVTPSAVSRRVGRAVNEMRRALAKMGYRSLDDAVLGNPQTRPATPKQKPGVIWSQKEDPPETTAPRREIRVGVYVSHSSLTKPNQDGFIGSLERQLRLIAHVAPDRYRLISLVEPGTEEYPLVERATRQFSLTAGMLDAADPDALNLLDVIFLGELQAANGRVLGAVGKAVENGVGLFNGGFIGLVTPGLQDPRTRKLYLAEHVSMYHTRPRHGRLERATVNRLHPLLSPLQEGTSMLLYGCGPVFIPDPARSQVYMTRDKLPDNVDSGARSLLAHRMPVFTLGTLGKGRVAIVAIMTAEPLATHEAFRGRFLMNIIDHLAEPRLAERAPWGV